MKNIIQFFIITLFIITGLLNPIKAQMVCSTTTSTTASNWPMTIINNAGGTYEKDGLKMQINGSGNIQVWINNKYQIFSGNYNTTNANNVPGTTHGWVLTVGTSGTSTNPYSFVSGSLSAGSSTGQKDVWPTSVECILNGNTQERRMTFNLTTNGRTYVYVLSYIYTFPNNFFTIRYQVTIPSGHPSNIPVRLSHGWDTYLDGNDSNPGFKSGEGNNITVGTQRGSGDNIVYEAFKYSNGVPFSGWYSGNYSNMNSNLSTNQNKFNNIVTPTSVDNGIGISIDFGSTPGTFTTETATIFKCNAPTEAPIITATPAQLTATCGKPVDLTQYFFGTTSNPTLRYNNLPSGIKLIAMDSNGNVIDPRGITKGGTYSVFFEDTNNANCTSPTTTITINEVSCCSTSPTLAQYTLSNTCPTTTVDLTKLYEGILPTGVNVIWYNNPSKTGSPVVNPTAVGTSGNYYAFINDTTNNCTGPASLAVAVTINVCCDAGTVAPLTY
jgi:trimeric autotransporter adhesin